MDNIPGYEDLLRQIKLNFWMAGIPFGDPKIYIRYYILIFLITLMIIEEGSFFVSKISSENLLELTQLAPCACIGILSVLKILSITPKRGKIFDLTERLGHLYTIILKDIQKIKVVKQELHLLKYLTKYFFVLNLILISVYNFSTLIFIVYQYFTKNKIVFSLPYAILLPFSIDSWLPWSVVYIHSIACESLLHFNALDENFIANNAYYNPAMRLIVCCMDGFICVLYFTTVDVLYCVLTSHVCNNLSIISDKLAHLQVHNVGTLGDIVREHQYILKLADDLEDIFTAPNLLNVLVGSIEICALGFNLTTGSLAQLPGSILFLTSVLLQILMMSVFGENIITESRKIGESAFLCKWYEMDEKSKKIILLIMTRSRKPQMLTAYKFSVISYGSFSKKMLNTYRDGQTIINPPEYFETIVLYCSFSGIFGFIQLGSTDAVPIISTSWSYFTILKTVYTPPEINHED